MKDRGVAVAGSGSEKITVPGIPFPVPPNMGVAPDVMFRRGTRLPAHQALPVRMLALEPDGVTMSVDWSEKLVGYPETGALMGGVVTTLLDHSAGIALVARLGAEARPNGTLDLRVDYLRSSARDETIVVEARCHRVTRHVAFMSGRAYHPSRPADPIALGNVTYAVDRASGANKEEPQVPNVVLRGAAHLPLTQPFPELVKRARASRDFSLLTRTIPYFSFLGLDLKEESGSLIVRLPPWEQHIGSVHTRFLHGGVIGGLLESAAILQLLAHDTVHIAKTINFTSEFLRGAELGDLFAKATVMRMGRRFASVRCEAWQADHKRLVATAHGNFLLA